MLNGMLSFSMIVFFWGMIENVHNNVCKSLGCIVNVIGRVRIVDIDKVRNLVLKNTKWL